MIILQWYCLANAYNQREAMSHLLKIKFVFSEVMMETLKNSESILNNMMS